MKKGNYLFRCWGRDQEKLTSLYLPDATEDSGAVCYWFETPADRTAFIAIANRTCAVLARDCVDPVDCDGRVADTHARTVVTLTLRFPDGRGVPIRYDFGYGYPDESAAFMWEEGNYSCDCNKRIFAAEALGGDSEVGGDHDQNPCGFTIAIENLQITHLADGEA